MGNSASERDMRIRHVTEVWDFDILVEYGKQRHDKDMTYIHMKSVWVILPTHRKKAC
jgi:hypothetical protein